MHRERKLKIIWAGHLLDTIFKFKNIIILLYDPIKPKNYQFLD